MMILDALHQWFVIDAVNDDLPYFWSTPVGAASIFLIFICSVIQLFKGKHDTLHVFYYWVMAGVSAIAMLHVHENSSPRHQMMVIVIAIAVKKVWDVYLLFKRGHRYGY